MRVLASQRPLTLSKHELLSRQERFDTGPQSKLDGRVLAVSPRRHMAGRFANRKLDRSVFDARRAPISDFAPGADGLSFLP